jgi:hypothetical protein
MAGRQAGRQAGNTTVFIGLNAVAVEFKLLVDECRKNTSVYETLHRWTTKKGKMDVQCLYGVSYF